MAVISEIAPNVSRISIFAQAANLQFNHFLVKDDEPLLYHTGLRGFHKELHEAVSKLIDVSELRHISFSHFESDKCGPLNEWPPATPNADVICSQVGAFVNVTDFIGRGRDLSDREVPFSLLADFSFAPRLGHWSAFRINAENVFLFGPVPSCRGRRTDHHCRCRWPLASVAEGIRRAFSWPMCPTHRSPRRT
jgi:glyoxylase-like metal-dependent hydrolase (beta-lactamase superfamily II)